MKTKPEQSSTASAEKAKQWLRDPDDRRNWAGIEAEAWTDRMLSALGNGVKGETSLLRECQAGRVSHRLASSETVSMKKPPTGEPYAGKPHVRFGGRGGQRLPYPYQSWARGTTPPPACHGLRRGVTPCERAVSSVGRASRLHREGRRFESVTAHHPASRRAVRRRVHATAALRLSTVWRTSKPSNCGWPR